MELVRITEDNRAVAERIALELFPNDSSSGMHDPAWAYGESLRDTTDYLRYFIVYDGGEPCGITGYYPVDDKTAGLGWFGLLPHKRGRGLGMAVLHETERRVMSLGFTRMDVYASRSNDAARRLYLSAGYEVTGDEDLHGEPVTNYSRELVRSAGE